MNEITIHHKLPTAEQYQRLRVVSGLSAKSEEAVIKGLANSLFAVVAEFENNAVGMGRVIGDGGCFCQVVDICVDPSFQGKGIGKQIMTAISGYLKTLPSSCYVSLLADNEAYKLYEQFDFKDTLPASKGMYLKIG